MSHADDLLARHWATIAANPNGASITPDELHTTITEWAKGPYRLNTQECSAVMNRLAALEAFVAGLGDPNRTSHFETRGDQTRTVTYTGWRPAHTPDDAAP